MRRPLGLLLLQLLLLVHGASAKKSKRNERASSSTKEEFRLAADAFNQDGTFPHDARFDGDDVSPRLSWRGAPKKTKSFVLLLDSDEKPAAAAAAASATTNHWAIYDIPSEVTELRDELSGAGSSDVRRLGMKDDAGQAPVVVDPMSSMMGMDGFVDPEMQEMQQNINSMVEYAFEESNRAKEGTNSFGGTVYRGPTSKGSKCTFKLYALSSRLDLPPGASKSEILQAIKGKVLGKASLSARL